MTRRKTVIIRQKIKAPDEASIEARAAWAEESARITAKTEAAKCVKPKVEAAMRALLLASPSGFRFHREAREAVIPQLAEKYEEMAFRFLRSAPPPARKDIEMEFLNIKEKATQLLLDLASLKEPSVEALHLAMKEGVHPPAKMVHWSTATMKFDRRPKALGDIMGRLETLVDAAHRAVPLTTAKTKKGPDQKVDTLEIAKRAANDYRFLTSEPPDRSKNGFPVFLAAIFKAFDRPHDSVGNFARKACDWWKEDRPLVEDEAFS
jgi:hypothetical protein